MASKFEIVARALESNPGMSLAEFQSKHKIKMTSSLFSCYKARFQQKTKKKKPAVSRKKIKRNPRVRILSYKSLAVFPSETLTTLTKNKMQELIDVLNKKKGLGLEMVEYADPKQVEIRERV